MADLERSDAGPDQASTYALLLADTYLVPNEAGKAPECLTSAAPRVWSEVAYYFKVRTPFWMRPRCQFLALGVYLLGPCGKTGIPQAA